MGQGGGLVGGTLSYCQGDGGEGALVLVLIGVTSSPSLPSFMAHSDCTEGGVGPGMGVESTVHIAVGAGTGMGAENIMRSCLHVLENALFHPCAHVLIILQ